MGTQQSSSARGEIDVRNVGGIEHATLEFTPGVTLLVGRNATNRTSLLQAFMAVLGSDDVSVKGDAEEARVALTLDGDTYTRRLQRSGGAVSSGGDPYLDDSELADLFAFLLESNEVRRAVERGDELHDLIMRPVDTDELQAEIDRLVDERERVERELDELEELKAELPEKEQRRADLEREIEATREALEAKEAELDDVDDVAEKREQRSDLEDRLDDLREKRSELEDVRYELETERETITELEREYADVEAELDDLPATPDDELADVEAELERLRDRKQRLESEVTELQSVVGFNEEMLSGDAPEALDPFADGDGDVTDELVEDAVVCWTCGSEVDRSDVEGTLDQLRALSNRKLDEVSDAEDAIDDLEAERRDLEESRRERERLDARLDELDDEIQRREANAERLAAERETLMDDVETIEATVEDLESQEYAAVLERHREANELEYELGRLESDLESVEDDIADIEDRLDDQTALEERRENVDDQITELRTRIERIERDAVEQFNDHMAAVLEILDYDNLDRIWLERRERDVTRGRRTVTETAFDLHVVRTTDSGTAYEDTVEHLSESEREITGLVLALAGYLAHEVYEDVPFIFLDSLEAIDAARIAKLVEYVSDYADYLLVALLTEDAAAVDDDYERITSV